MKLEENHTITLTLNKDEATILEAIVGNIGGVSETNPEFREFTNELYVALHNKLGRSEYYELLTRQFRGYINDKGH